LLKETYVAKLKTFKNDAIKIKVGYPSIFSPSDELLSDFNELKRKYLVKGINESNARKKAWEKTKFEKRYREMIMSNPKIIEKLKEIKKLAEEKDVYLYCYCGKPLCHRFILMDIIKKI
jgi:hypothetical protein